MMPRTDCRRELRFFWNTNMEKRICMVKVLGGHAFASNAVGDYVGECARNARCGPEVLSIITVSCGFNGRNDREEIKDIRSI